MKDLLLDMLKLEKGWNGYTADPPNEVAVNNAIAFTETASEMKVVVKRVAPTALEGVAVAFKKLDSTVIVEFYNKGTAHALFSNRTTEYIRTQEVVLSEEGFKSFLQEVVAYLEKAMVRKKSNKSPKKEYHGFVPTRKPRYTEAQVAYALKECGGFMYATAHYLDVNYTTVKNYMKKYPALKKIRKESQGLMLDRVENSLIVQALKGNVRAINRILSHWGKKRGWEPQYKTINQINPPPVQTDLPKLTEEVKQRLIEEAKKRHMEQQKKSEEGLKQLECGLKELNVQEAEIVEKEESA